MSALAPWLQRKFRHARSKYTKEKEPGIPKGLPVLPESYQDLCFDPFPSLSPFFQKLPLEIRRTIYLAAFGNRTLHMDLQYRHPHIPGSLHAGLNGEDNLFDVSIPKSWLWWSCVCHRTPCFQHDLWLDICSIGFGRGNDGDWCRADEMGPRNDCYVGVTGWMMSCRQAYMEILPILYSDNTIYIYSVPFSSHILRVLPLQNLAMITSLEFMWDLDTSPDVQPWIRSEDVEKVKLKRWKVFKDLMSMINKSTFKSLQKLVLVIVDNRDGWRWFPDEIMAASQTKPPQFILLDPPDRIAREFGGQLQKFELTLPYDRAADLESKLVDKMDKTRVIMRHPGLAMIRKFWRSIPKQLPIHEELGFSGELGYWIIHGHCLSPGIWTCSLGTGRITPPNY